MTRLEKAEDVLTGEAAVKKPWDYVAHHPRSVRGLRKGLWLGVWGGVWSVGGLMKGFWLGDGVGV